MQNLIYIFILAIGAATGVTAFFGLGLTVIEAVFAALLVLFFCLYWVERTLRARATARLERSVQDLSRLLSTNAQAGQALSKRIAALEGLESRTRMEVMEADVSVLGTVVRQLAESVSDIEEAQGHLNTSVAAPKQDVARHQPETVVVEEDEPEPELDPTADLLEPVIPVEMLRQAIAEGRLLFYVQPIVTVPDRKTHGYDLVPHLLLEDGEVAGPEDFMPTSGYGDILRLIEGAAIQQAITFVRRARTAGMPSRIYVPMSVASLGNAATMHQLTSQLEANQAIVADLRFSVSDEDWRTLAQSENKSLEVIAERGGRFSVHSSPSLRLSFAAMMDLGVRSVRTSARRLVSEPEGLTDLHIADLVPYLRRFEMDLIVTGVSNDQHILTCIDDGISLVSGPHLGKPGPIRADLAADPNLAARQVAN